MSRALMVCAVDLSALRGVAGSRDSSLLRRLLPSSPARALVEGGPVTPDGGTNAVEELCQLLGRQLPNGTVAPVSSDTMDAVDEALDRAGVNADLRLTSLALRGLPLALPAPQDYPLAGYVEAEALASASAPLERASSPDTYADDVLREMEDWLAVALAMKRGLVGFYC